MKVLKYYIYNCENRGTEEVPELVGELMPVILGWSEANEEIARREAYNGQYTIEDDEEIVVAEPTTDEILNALLGVSE